MNHQSTILFTPAASSDLLRFHYPTTHSRQPSMLSLCSPPSAILPPHEHHHHQLSLSSADKQLNGAKNTAAQQIVQCGHPSPVSGRPLQDSERGLSQAKRQQRLPSPPLADEELLLSFSEAHARSFSMDSTASMASSSSSNPAVVPIRPSSSIPSSPSKTRKAHTCSVCQKQFERPSTLRTHMNSHTGDRPFTCPFKGCDRSFSVRSNMRRHQLKCESRPAGGNSNGDDNVYETPRESGSPVSVTSSVTDTRSSS